jgi:hypothetical protein
MNTTKQHWDSIKHQITQLELLSYEETKTMLKKNNYFEKFLGKARNRTMLKENPVLYKAIMHHTSELEDVFKLQNTYKTSWNFSHRIRFIVEHDVNIKGLKCVCGKKYTWATYCRYCPDYKKSFLGKTHIEETKRKQRLSTLEYLKKQNGQLAPRYNRDSIGHIEEYGKAHNLTFMHAENGGEYFIGGLGYFLDGYDPINNVAIEFDEKHHFDPDGQLKEKDRQREKQITDLLGCRFIRIKYDSV